MSPNLIAIALGTAWLTVVAAIFTDFIIRSLKPQESAMSTPQEDALVAAVQAATTQTEANTASTANAIAALNAASSAQADLAKAQQDLAAANTTIADQATTITAQTTAITDLTAQLKASDDALAAAIAPKAQVAAQ
jgi:predicted  nucleic acid-binding Zn-ribbon protein